MADNCHEEANSLIAHLSKGYIPAKAVYPPKVVTMGHIDHVHDTKGTYYSRDIGRSSVIGGNVYYQFGDTFCHDDKDNAVIISNTTAIVEDPRNPFRTSYPSFSPNGVVKPLLELNEEERAREEETAAQEYRARITLWQFGGIVETDPGKGLLWYEKRELYWDKDMEEGKHIGIGIADVYVDMEGNINAERRDGLLFGPDEPLVGNVAAILDGDYVYLMGNRGRRDIILAKVHKDEAGDRKAYRQVVSSILYGPSNPSRSSYWDGESYGEDMSNAVAIMQDFQSACFFRSEMFGAHLPWVMVGVNAFCDSMIQVGAAEKLEGMWIPHAVYRAPTHNKDKFSEGCICYCIYAHPWASVSDKSSFFVTWSEQYPGEVIGAELTFEMGKSTLQPEAWWEKIWLPGYPDVVCNDTYAELEFDEEFQRLVSEGDISISGGDVPMKICVPTNVPYLLLQGTIEDKVTHAARYYRNKLDQKYEAWKRTERVANSDSTVQNGVRGFLERAFNCFCA